MTTPRNIKIMYVAVFVFGTIFYLPLLALFFQNQLNNTAAVAMIFAIQAIFTAIFEVPTGAIADLFGRKRTLMVSNVLVILAMIWLYFSTTFWALAIFAIIKALDETLWSGSDQALIYDTLKAEGQESRYKKVISNYYALWPLGAVVGSIAGGYIAEIYSLKATIIFSLIPYTIGLLLTSLVKEPDYHKSQVSVYRQSLDCTKLMFKNRQLFLLTAAGFLLWGFGETLHELTPLFLEFKQIPLIYFGYTFAAIYLLSSIGHFLSHFVSEKIGNKATMIITLTIGPIFTLLSTLTFGVQSLIYFVIPSLMWGLKGPVNDHLIQLEAPSHQRATIMSAHSFVVRIGMFIFGPLLGLYANKHGINTAFMGTAILLFSVPIILLFIKDHK